MKTIWSSMVAASVALAPVRSAVAAEHTKQECVAANDAAQDLRRAGKLRAAREKLAFCISSTCPGPVREDCAQRLEEVDKAMPIIVFAVKDGAGNDVVAVRVTIDGEPLAEKVDGAAIPVDPGAHRFAFEADGLGMTEKTIVVSEGDKDRHVGVVLAAPPSAPDSTASVDASNAPTAAYVAFGAGGVGFIVGAIFAGLAVHTTTECPGNTCQPLDKVAQDSKVNGETAAAAIGFSAALVGAGVGVGVLLLRTSTAPATSSGVVALTRITTRLGLGWVGLEGSFP